MDDENPVFFSQNALNEALLDSSFIGQRRAAVPREVAVEIPRSASAPVWTPAPPKRVSFMRRRTVLGVAVAVLLGVPLLVIVVRLFSRTTE